jgi:hypothetical protein
MRTSPHIPQLPT